MKIRRRQFVRQTARATLAAGSLGAMRKIVGAKEDKPPAGCPAISIVDTHQHLWDLNKFPLRWVRSSKRLNRSFVTKDYLEATRGLNVVKAVYMEVAVNRSQQLEEAQYVVELCKRDDNPTCAAVIAGRPGEEGFEKYITRFKDSPYVKGIRRILHASKKDQSLCSDKRFIHGIRLLGELGMSFDLCMPPEALPDGARLVDECPDTQFILDHCGNADPKKSRKELAPWRRGIAELAQRKNVICKISGIIARANKESWTPDDLTPIVNHCLDSFGPDRVIFASDWPVCTRVATFRQWVEALKEIVRSRGEAEQCKLFHDNAVRFYGLG